MFYLCAANYKKIVYSWQQRVSLSNTSLLYTMSKKVNAPEMPLCTNILRLQSYLLSPDEVVLFDWFIVKQISFRYKDFHYSQSRIEEETRIKRSRQDAIMKQFCSLGFLKPEVRVNKVTRGKVKYFNVDFNVLSNANILSQVIDQNQPLFKDYLFFLEYHANRQYQDDETEKENATDKRAVDRIYKLFNTVYEERRVMYNTGKLTEEKPTRIKSPTELPRNKAINKKISHLSKLYNNNTIKGAFTAYIDSVFKEHEFPYKPLDHFLSYNDSKEGFGVVEYYINRFTIAYTTAR